MLMRNTPIAMLSGHDVSDWSLNHLSPHQPRNYDPKDLSLTSSWASSSGRDRENKINDERRDDLATKGHS